MADFDEEYLHALAAAKTRDVAGPAPELTPLSFGSRVVVLKGCKVRGVDKGVSARIQSVEPLGAEYSHSVRVVLKVLNGFKSGKTFVFFASHQNRLSSPVVRMNDGNPSHTIEVRRA